MGFEPTTVGFGVQRSTVGATPSRLSITPQSQSKTTLGNTRRLLPKLFPASFTHYLPNTTHINLTQSYQ